MPTIAETSHPTEITTPGPKSESDRGAANSLAQLRLRVTDGRLSWAGPLLVVTGRTVLIVLAQGIFAVIFLIRGSAHPWFAAAPWWTVYGTLVDVGCLALLWRFTRKEGVRLRDLIGPIRMRYGQDVFLAIAILVVMFPLFWFGGWITGQLLGPYQTFPGLTDARVLPLWATIYSFSLFWMIWSPTEEMTYNAYALPRLQALGGTWVSAIVVAFWWTIQHPFLPFLLDWRNFVWRFLAFLPAIIVLCFIYLRLRRLGPLILAHWTMDIVAILMTLKHSVG